MVLQGRERAVVTKMAGQDRHAGSAPSLAITSDRWGLGSSEKTVVGHCPGFFFVRSMEVISISRSERSIALLSESSSGLAKALACYEVLSSSSFGGGLLPAVQEGSEETRMALEGADECIPARRVESRVSPFLPGSTPPSPRNADLRQTSHGS